MKGPPLKLKLIVSQVAAIRNLTRFEANAPCNARFQPYPDIMQLVV